MFIFHAIIPALYSFQWKCYCLSYSTFIFSMLESQSWKKKKKNSDQNGKVEKMVVLVKTFEHYHHKFQLFQQSSKIVKEFETEV